jgi:phosphatidylinositol alpha-1,6-mannosyltransferase
MTDVLVVTPDFPPRPGGIQTLLARLVASFPSYRAVVLAPRDPEERLFDRGFPAPVLRIPPDPAAGRVAKATCLARLLIRAVATARRERPRVVLVGHVLLGPVGWIIRRLQGVPYVVYVHAGELARPRPLLVRALRAADRVIAVSAYSRTLALRVGVRPERVVVIGHGADLPAPGAAESPGPAEARPTILTISRMDELYKGHDVLLRSLPLVSGRVPSVRLVLLGDGKFRDFYRRLAAALGVADRVVLLGRVPDSARDAWLRACDVLALPSRVSPVDGLGEGFGIVFLEAGAHGKPVLAGRAGGAVDAVTDGETGLLVEPDNVREVADGLIRLLTDGALGARLGANARHRIAGALSWPSVAARVEGVLREVAAGRQAAAP